MKFIKNNAGLLRSVRSWGALGLVLALAVITSSSQYAFANQGSFYASSGCQGFGNTFTLSHPVAAPGIVISALLVIGPYGLIYQAPGGILLTGQAQHQWGWDQKTGNPHQSLYFYPVGTYLAVVVVSDDNMSLPGLQPAYYSATFQIDQPGPQC